MGMGRGEHRCEQKGSRQEQSASNAIGLDAGKFIAIARKKKEEEEAANNSSWKCRWMNGWIEEAMMMDGEGNLQ